MKITLISEDGKNMGEFEYGAAQNIAIEQGLGLYEVNSANKIFKIADVGKIKYDKKQKIKKLRAQQRTQKVKEVQIRPTIEVADLKIKLSKIEGFLRKGLKTKIVMRFKGSQLPYKKNGINKIIDISNQMVKAGLAKQEGNLSESERQVSVLLDPSK